MDAALTTLGLLLVMAVALVALARSWPSSSRLGGYRARPGREPKDGKGDAEERGQAGREDDDARWRWPGPRDE